MKRVGHHSLEFGLIAAVMLIMVLGFWDIYFGADADAPPHHHLHITTVFIWIGLLLTQLTLMARGVRRFTRLTNAFSKKVENHAYAVALHMMYCNFVRIHKTLRVTPAVAAGVSDRLWGIGDIVALIEKAESQLPTKRGHYKKREA